MNKILLGLSKNTKFIIHQECRAAYLREHKLANIAINNRRDISIDDMMEYVNEVEATQKTQYNQNQAQKAQEGIDDGNAANNDADVSIAARLNTAMRDMTNNFDTYFEWLKCTDTRESCNYYRAVLESIKRFVRLTEL